MEVEYVTSVEDGEGTDNFVKYAGERVSAAQFEEADVAESNVHELKEEQGDEEDDAVNI